MEKVAPALRFYWRSLAGFSLYFLLSRAILTVIPNGHRYVSGVEVETLALAPRLDLLLCIPIALAVIFRRGLSIAATLVRAGLAGAVLMGLALLNLMLAAMRMRGELTLLSKSHVMSLTGFTAEVVALFALVGAGCEVAAFVSRRFRNHDDSARIKS